MRLLGLRHAPALVTGICYGRSDVPVRAERSRLEALARSLREHRPPITHLLASPSVRCAELATFLAPTLGLEVVFDGRLLELDFGEWEGLSWSAIEDRDPERLDRWMRNYLEERPPGGETLADLEARVRDFVRQWKSIEGLPLLVTHAGVLRALRVAEGKSDWASAMRWPVPHLETIELHPATT